MRAVVEGSRHRSYFSALLLAVLCELCVLSSVTSVLPSFSLLCFFPSHRPAIAAPNSLRVWITRKIASRVTIPTMCAEPSSPCVTTGI